MENSKVHLEIVPAVTQAEADPSEIEKGLITLFMPDMIVEIRAIKKRLKQKPHIISERYDLGDITARKALIEKATLLNNDGFNIYSTMNYLSPESSGTASDNDINFRRWLLIDLDPVRSADTAATDAQLSLALTTSEKIKAYLDGEGWAAPVVAESGNGVHLLYPIDLAADDGSRDLIKNVLNVLAEKFSTAEVEVDTSVYNASRITKLYGTASVKGEHTTETPLRLSRIKSSPERVEVVTEEQLQALAPTVKPQALQVAQGRSEEGGKGTILKFDLEGFMGRLAIPYKLRMKGDIEFFDLRHCPFNEEHNSGEVAVIRTPDGGLGFKCFHNSCADKHWREVRNLVDERLIVQLSTLDNLEYHRERNTVAKQLGIPPTSLDKLVKDVAKAGVNTNDDELFPLVEPWESDVDGAALLSEISAAVLRFVVCRKEDADAVALWCVMTWLMDSIYCAPILNIKAPEKNCGKSTLLEAVKNLVYRPIAASNISTAAVFRSIELWGPTMLLDEADSFMNQNEELRGVINSGHTKASSYVIRTVGEDHTPTRFSTWCPKALAGIGRRAGTIEERSINVCLQRKTVNEVTESMQDLPAEYFAELTSRIKRWSDDHRSAIKAARPTLPKHINDRQKDNWRALVAIADTAGGDWPARSRAALSAFESHQVELAKGVELLHDIKAIFEDGEDGPKDRVSTLGLLTELCHDPEKRWATYNRGNEISAKQVSKILKEYGIGSKNIRLESQSVVKGFTADQFTKVFARYLPQSKIENIDLLS